MNLPEPIQPKRNEKTTLIVVIVVVLVLLCCIVLAITLVGIFFYLQQNDKLSTLIPESVPTPTIAQAPTATFLPLQVAPVDPTSSTYLPLQELIPNWEGSTAPGTQTWSVTVSSNQPVLIFSGWCTTTTDILEQNTQHISYKLVVDDQEVDTTGLYNWDSQESDRVCRSYAGLISSWAGTNHTIVMTMTFDQKINDGWEDYPAGDYTDVYNITVSQ